MEKTMLSVESEFELMVSYQVALESRSVLIKNSPQDEFKYSLFKTLKPYPTYEEYLQGDDFQEGELIMQSSDIVQIEHYQNNRRFIYTDQNKETLTDCSARV